MAEAKIQYEQLSEEFADQMIQDRNNLYNIFHRIGIDPENQNNYKDPKKVEEARSFIERNLFASSIVNTFPYPFFTDTAQLALHSLPLSSHSLKYAVKYSFSFKFFASELFVITTFSSIFTTTFLICLFPFCDYILAHYTYNVHFFANKKSRAISTRLFFYS